jgi:hypothetical protein
MVDAGASEELINRLRADAERLAADIFKAERSLELCRAIGRHSDRINSDNFGPFFGGLQDVLTEHMMLIIARLYEKPNKRHRLSSIPVMLEQLEREAAKLPLVERKLASGILVSMGEDREFLDKLSDNQFKATLLCTFRNELPDVENSDVCDLSRGLESLRTIRDKRIAHHEVVAEGLIPAVTWRECMDLLGFAQKFLGAVGWAFLCVVYLHEGRYFLSDDAKRSARALRRLLERAGLEEAGAVKSHNTGPQADA